MDYFAWIEEAAELLTRMDGYFHNMPVEDIIKILEERIQGLPLVYAIHKPSSQDLALFVKDNPVITRIGMENVSFIVDYVNRKKDS